MDDKALLNRKKQMLGPYTDFIFQSWQKLKGTKHESTWATLYETITNDRKILKNNQINVLADQLLDQKLKAIKSDVQAPETNRQDGGWFNAENPNRTRNQGETRNRGETRNESADSMFSRRDKSRPAEQRNDFRRATSPQRSDSRNQQRENRKFYRSHNDFRTDYQSNLSPASNGSDPRGHRRDGKYFDRGNPDAGYRLGKRASRSPVRRSKSRDPRVNKYPRLDEERSNESNPRDHRFSRDKSADPRRMRDKSRDPRVNRNDRSRDPRKQKSLTRSTSKERERRSTGGWFTGTGERYQESGHSNRYSNKGWFDGPRRQQSRSPHRYRPRSRSSSPQSRYQPKPQFWDNRSRSTHKVANVNSRFNKSMPRSPPRHTAVGPSTFIKRNQSQGRAHTEQSGAINKRYDPEMHGRPQLHHGMLRDIKDHILENKKPPPKRRMSCFVPKEPEVIQKPESFGKIRQRRMSCFESKEPAVSKKPESFGAIKQRRMSVHQPTDDNGTKDGSSHPKFSNLNTQKKEDFYPNASEITVEKSNAIAAAKKILSTKHVALDDMAKHLVDVFGEELFIAAVKQKLANENSDGDVNAASKNKDPVKEKPIIKNQDPRRRSETPSVSSVREAPSAPVVEEPPQKKLKTARPTKVIQLSMDEVIELSKTQIPQEVRSEKKTKNASSSSKVDRSASVETASPKNSRRPLPPRRSSIGMKPGPKKKEGTKSKASSAVSKTPQTEKVIKSAKNTEKDVPKHPTKKPDRPKSPVETAAKEVVTEPDSSAPPKRKKHKGTELDKLHKQIKDFHDGSQIASFGSRRACTKQPHNYTGEQLSPPESSKAVARAEVPLVIKDQLLKYNIKQAQISLRRLSLDGVAMPVKLDSQGRPILTKQVTPSKNLPPVTPMKNLPPATSPKKQKKSPKVIVETPLVVAEETPKQEQTARKRVGIWNKSVASKKPKKSPPVDDDNCWEDVEDEGKSAQTSPEKTKKVPLQALVSRMNFWLKSIKSARKSSKVTQSINSLPKVSEEQKKPAQPEATPAQPVTAPSPSVKSEPATKEDPQLNFEVKVLSSGTRLYQCKLCLFYSDKAEPFMAHIKSKHTLVHYPKPCPKCDVKTDGTMESEFRHMLTHYQGMDRQLAAKTDAPVLRLKSIPGDRLSTTSPVPKTSSVAPPIQTNAVDKPVYNVLTKKPAIPIIPLPSVVKSASNISPSTIPAKPAEVNKSSAIAVIPAAPINSSAVPAKLSALGNNRPIVITRASATSSTTVSAPLSSVAQPNTSTGLVPVLLTLVPNTSQMKQTIPINPTQTVSPRLLNLELQSVTGAKSQFFTLKNPPSDSPNMKFYAEQTKKLVAKPVDQTKKLFIQPINKEKMLRPWLSEHSSKPTKIAHEMLRDHKCLAAMFKCMGSSCSFYTSNVTVFQEHLNLHKVHQAGDEVNFLSCAYCECKTTTTARLTTHIINEHGYDGYQCAFCFFRAYNDFHVFDNHQSKHHPLQLRSVIECLTVNVKKSSNLTALMEENVPQLKCFYCDLKFFIESSYVEHLRFHTDKTINFECKVCSGRVNISNVLEHFLCYNIGHFQCLYCDRFGSATAEIMEAHLAEKHSSELPNYIERVFSGETANPRLRESLTVRMVKKSDKNVLRMNFTPQELTNVENKDRLNGKFGKKAINIEKPRMAVVENAPKMNVAQKVTLGSKMKIGEVIATTSAESANSLMISSVVSLAGESILLSSDED